MLNEKMKLKSHKGTTLAEILIVILILAITMSIMGYILARVNSTYKRGKLILNAQQRLSMISNAISTDLTFCNSIVTPGKSGDPLSFNGPGSQTITFKKYKAATKDEETITYKLTPSPDFQEHKYNLVRTDSSGESVIDTDINDLNFKYADQSPMTGNFDGSAIKYYVELVQPQGLKKEFCKTECLASVGPNTGVVINAVTIKENINYLNKLNFSGKTITTER